MDDGEEEIGAQPPPQDLEKRALMTKELEVLSNYNYLGCKVFA